MSAPDAPRSPLLPAESPWRKRLSRSTFFLCAVLVHLIVFLGVAGWIIFPGVKPPSEFGVVNPPTAFTPPAPPTDDVAVKVPTEATSSGSTAVISSSNGSPDFSFTPADLSVAIAGTSPGNVPIRPPVQAPPSRHDILVQTMKEKWNIDYEKLVTGETNLKTMKASFSLCLATYANGDWGCNSVIQNGQIVAGALPDLVEKINQWGHGNIKAEMVPTPMSISSPELLTKMPPFIFFTGHKDFVLTDAEISNLQKYLQNGGAIWGDNCLAGEGSRFDVAFRREMKRVLPDKDKNFEALDLSHDLFTKSWFRMSKIPTGMNYYQEQLLHIDIEGKLAILYTPNDYSDLFSYHILAGDQTGDLHWPNDNPPLLTNKVMCDRHDTFFRNFDLAPALAAQELGMNIVGHLLVRFADRVELQ